MTILFQMYVFKDEQSRKTGLSIRCVKNVQSQKKNFKIKIKKKKTKKNI